MGKRRHQAIALGKKLAADKQDEPCVACGGSGRYDVSGGPKCAACNGSGRQSQKQSKTERELA